MPQGDDLGCFVCRKHRGEEEPPGGPIYEDGLVYVGHAHVPQRRADIYLGWLLVETKRHAPGLADLTEAGAQAVGLWVTRMSRALRECVGAEHVYAFVLGDGVPHLHVHVVPRYRGAPRESWGVRVDEWPGAPRGDAAAVAALCHRLRGWLAAA